MEAFQQHLVATHKAGLMNAVNMDTGYVNYLSDAEKNEVLRWTRAALGKDVPFVAGAYIENEEGDDVVALYRRQMDAIVAAGAIADFVSDAASARKTGRGKSGSLPRGVQRLSTPCWRSNWEKCSRRTAKFSTKRWCGG